MILLRLLGKIIAATMTLITSLSMTVSEARSSKKLFTSTIMHKLEVDTIDNGGTLLFSDSPEYVKENGILYTDVVEGDVRLLFYHLNESSVNKRIAVVVENVSNVFNTVDITRGVMSEPSEDFLNVGKSVQTHYMDKAFHSSLYMLKGDKKLLVDDISSPLIKPGQLVYGVYDFYAAHSVKVSVLMYPQAADPIEFSGWAKVLPKDEYRLRGTYSNMNRILTAKKVYNPAEDGIMYIMLADDVNDIFKTGIDSTDNSEVKDVGNYGVNYTINLKTTAPTRICLTPLGGVYAGAMRVNYKGKSKMIQTPKGKLYFGDKMPKEPESVQKAREEGLSFLTNYTELADLGIYEGDVSFEYSPPGASNLPVNIILMPVDKN